MIDAISRSKNELVFHIDDFNKLSKDELIALYCNQVFQQIASENPHSDIAKLQVHVNAIVGPMVIKAIQITKDIMRQLC